MAYYAYKEVRDLIPDSFMDEFIERFEKEYGREYDGDPNYDGDMWLLTTAYISHLEEKLSAAIN